MHQCGKVPGTHGCCTADAARRSGRKVGTSHHSNAACIGAFHSSALHYNGVRTCPQWSLLQLYSAPQIPKCLATPMPCGPVHQPTNGHARRFAYLQEGHGEQFR